MMDLERLKTSNRYERWSTQERQMVILELIAELEAARAVVEAAKDWAAKCPVPNSWTCDEPCKAFDLCAALAAYAAVGEG
jgi:hypothetical protein